MSEYSEVALMLEKIQNDMKTLEHLLAIRMNQEKSTRHKQHIEDLINKSKKKLLNGKK